MRIEIGADEAKAKLPELLRSVQQGKHYTITLRGEDISDLVPSHTSHRGAVAAAVAGMRQLIASHPPMLGIDTKALIEDGRD